jgi:hypothetical protein
MPKRRLMPVIFAMIPWRIPCGVPSRNLQHAVQTAITAIEQHGEALVNFASMG